MFALGDGANAELAVKIFKKVLIFYFQHCVNIPNVLDDNVPWLNAILLQTTSIAAFSTDPSGVDGLLKYFQLFSSLMALIPGLP